MNKADAVQWLGNRGHDIEVSDIIRCKKLGKYLFLIDKEYAKEVELYDMTDMYAECIDSYDSSTFKWNKDFMRKTITGEV
tara:strand:- start:1056 stop:1295 length:240 start_codon:yes stop_codon:yes gene_type:complete